MSIPLYQTKRSIYLLQVVRTTRSCPYCEHSWLSTYHLNRHSQRYLYRIRLGDRICILRKGGGNDGALWQFLHKSSRGSYETVHSHSVCTVYEPIGLPRREETRNVNLRHFHQESGTPNTIVRPSKVVESSNVASALG